MSRGLGDVYKETVTAQQNVVDALLANAALVKGETLSVELTAEPGDAAEPAVAVEKVGA